MGWGFKTKSFEKFSIFLWVANNWCIAGLWSLANKSIHVTSPQYFQSAYFYYLFWSFIAEVPNFRKKFFACSPWLHSFFFILLTMFALSWINMSLFWSIISYKMVLYPFNSAAVLFLNFHSRGRDGSGKILKGNKKVNKQVSLPFACVASKPFSYTSSVK